MVLLMKKMILTTKVQKRRQSPVIKRYPSLLPRRIFYLDLSIIVYHSLRVYVCISMGKVCVCVCIEDGRTTRCEVARSVERSEGGDGQKIYGGREKRASLVAVWQSGLPFEALYTPGIS